MPHIISDTVKHHNFVFTYFIRNIFASLVIYKGAVMSETDRTFTLLLACWLAHLNLTET